MKRLVGSGLGVVFKRRTGFLWGGGILGKEGLVRVCVWEVIEVRVIEGVSGL